LNDSAVEKIKKIPKVILAFPDIRFPVRLRYKGKETKVSLSAIPSGMKEFYPFNHIKTGAFFSEDAAFEILLKEKTLKEMGFVTKPSDTVKSSGKKILIKPENLINTSIQIISKDIDLSKIMSDPFFIIQNPTREMPFKDTVMNFVIKGIIPDQTEFGIDRFASSAVIPIDASKKIPKLGFNNVWDLLGNNSKKGSYSSIYVRVKDVKDIKEVADSLKKEGFNVFAISEELKEIKRSFIIMDSLLGAIGVIALVVAALGIINTMLMSILERTREIGIMKSIGGSEGEIKMIFFVEASVIGLTGALFGIVLGWVVTRIANVVINSQIRPQGLPSIELFSFPWWLILGAIAFSVVISLIAGLYPAIRAARIDPVKALRHD
jgi:putative ABC transport system permease protein